MQDRQPRMLALFRKCLAYLPLLISLPALAAEFYASPEGTSEGDGSRERPWSLATALAQPSFLRPGDTLWLLGGTYSGTFISRLTGSNESPMTDPSVAGPIGYDVPPPTLPEFGVFVLTRQPP